jgi:V/A-type H+-transporting ATPase subunit D
MKLRVPPGRAGRLWLRERLEAARKAADLLEHKQRELEVELKRIGTIAERRERAWEDAARDAAEWLARADVVGTALSIRLASELLKRPAEVQLQWRQVMGVRYAADHVTRVPEPSRVSSLSGGSALAPATSAYRSAVDAAVGHAVARSALARIRTEIDRTTRRLRALQLRAIPAHERALSALELALDEKSREEAIAAHWAAGAPTTLTEPWSTTAEEVGGT